MNYVIIENWENMTYPMLVTNLMGETKVFDNLEDAKNEADNCHSGIVVPLDKELINVIKY